MNPILKIIISMTIWGSVGIFVRKINLPSIEIAFLRAVIASVILIAGRVFIKGGSLINNFKNYNRKEIILLFISGITLAFNWIFLFQAYKYTTIANAILSYYLAPVFVILLSPIILKEKITIKSLISVMVAMIGLTLILSQQKLVININDTHLIGILFGVLAAILYASVVILNKTIKEIGSFDRTVVQIFLSALVLLPIILYRNNLNISGSETIFNIIILGVVHTGIAYLLYFSSIKYVNAQKVSILSYIDPISAVVFGVIFLSEPIGIYHVIGGILILFSTIFSDK